MSTTPYMSLLLPTVSSTIGPLYATENNNAFTTIDSHNHTSGQGVLVPTSGLNINADLSFASFNATALRSARLSTNASPLALVTDLGCLYRSGVDLWFNDGSGNQIQLTASGALNAASIGGIGGDYATSTASVAYSNSSKTFTFLQDTNKSSLLDTGTILLRRTDITSSAATTIQANPSLTAGWTLTLPTAVPASTSLVQIDSSGNLSFSNTPPTLASLTLTGDLVVGTTSTFTGATTFSANTATTVPYLNGSKVLTSSAVTPTELGYLAGIFSQPVCRSAITAFTSTGTWTKATLNPKFVRVTVIGGGGGGGGCENTGSGEGAAAGGGGGGGTSIKTILAATLGATETVTIGAAGTAASAGNNAGGTGGTSSFGTHATATGGTGGGGGESDNSASTIAAGGTGGAGASGDVNFNGGAGGSGRVIGGFAIPMGVGGSSSMAGNTKCEGGTGTTGLLYGGGGAGSTSPASQSSRAGSAGAKGVVIVEEFY